jgi:hypothetical protein
MSSPYLLISNDLHLYREVLLATLQKLRPDITARAVSPTELDSNMQHDQPWLVICSALTRTIEEHAPAWIMLPPEGEADTMVSVAGRRYAIPHPTLNRLLQIIDHIRGLRSPAICPD